MDIGILEMCLDPQGHSPHSSTPRRVVEDRVNRGGKAFKQQHVILIVEVTLQMVELIGLIEEDGDRPRHLDPRGHSLYSKKG
jgi:hypothetical protein